MSLGFLETSGDVVCGIPVRLGYREFEQQNWSRCNSDNNASLTYSPKFNRCFYNGITEY